MSLANLRAEAADLAAAHELLMEYYKGLLEGEPAAVAASAPPARLGGEVRRKQCQICMEYGHNSRTCKDAGGASPRPKAQRKCGSCGEVGHNKRTCVNRPMAAVVASDGTA